MAEPWPRRAGGIQAATGAESEVISVPKVLSADDVARWTVDTCHALICGARKHL
jgi:hypothetical protein